MNKKHVRFKDIPQFRNIIRNVINQSQFVELDENGEAIFDRDAKKPIVTFTGTVKLHGTNAAVCTNGEEIWCQSRERILSTEKDNQGFHQFFLNKKESFKKLLNIVEEDIRLDDYIISIFGEFCGQGIQSGVSISILPKMFVIFAVKISLDNKASYYTQHSNLEDPDNQIYNISNFQHYFVDINFNHPEIAQNKFVELVSQVEKECPVGKALGVIKNEDDTNTNNKTNTVGEGIVWIGYYKGVRHIFKTKGKKHSTSKTKTIAPVDIEKVASIMEFVEYAVTENRMQQAIQELFTSQGIEPSVRQMGDFLKWMNHDIAKEETDVLGENNLILKDVNKSVSKKASNWFLTFLDKSVGLN
jgi:hypothetical protein